MRPAAERALRKIARPDQRRIRDRIDALADEPHPAGVKPLQGSSEGLLRIRVGDYRVIYLVKTRQRGQAALATGRSGGARKVQPELVEFVIGRGS